MATIKELRVNSDDYNLVQLVMQVTGMPEPAAATAVMEIGLYNIVNYPTGLKKVDGILYTGKWPDVVKRVKVIWNIK